MSQNDDLMCGICLEVVNLPVKVPSCSHVFCFLCMKGVINRLGKVCPLCRATFSEEPEDLQLDRDLYEEVVASKKRRVKAVPKDKIQWQYSGRNTGWWDYDPVSNAEIEKGYQICGWDDSTDGSGSANESEGDGSETSSGKVDNFLVSIGATNYHIDFREMTQESCLHPGRKRSIRRVVIPVGSEDDHDTKGIAGLDKKHLGISDDPSQS